MHFLDKLDDSPIFRKQLQGLEESADVLRDRCQKFHKGCWKYTNGLGEAYDGDILFANSIDSFGGGHDDPLSVAIGGPVLSKFTIALREIGTYKEVLRSQVEHMLTDRLMQFANSDVQDVKDLRKRFEKASLHYDQVRERFLCLKKGAKMDVVSEVEEDLRRSRSTFEQTRFNLATTLSSIEARKKFEFLEAVSETMSAHLCYFKQGYELLLQLEPYIQQVLTYAQQSRERATYEQVALASQMQEYMRHVEHDNQHSFSDLQTMKNGDGVRAVGRSSHKMIEAVMQSTPKGKVQIIKQGYLLKRSSSLRGDWKRRFFVLDSRGMLYYYRKQLGKTMGSPKKHSSQCRTHLSMHHHTGLLGRFFSSHHHGSTHDDTTVAHQTVNLLTSTIKPDAEQTDLRFCFQIISPLKSYSVQAENALDRMDWIDKITGVIASLLNAQNLEQASHSHRLSHSTVVSGLKRTGSESSSLSSSSDADHMHLEDPSAHIAIGGDKPPRSPRASVEQERPIDALKGVPGNNVCADCNSPEPDWASLNLGILLCIECSGVHRNLGVHISKIRSLTLDVKVWEPSVICLFQSLGNMFANSVWEGLRSDLQFRMGSNPDRLKMESLLNKPSARDPLAAKEKYIRLKYAEKSFAYRAEWDPEITSVARLIWNAVGANDKKKVYCLLICANGDVNTTFDQAAMKAQLSSQVVVSQPTLNNNDEDTQLILNNISSSSTAFDLNVTQTIRNVASSVDSFNLTYFEEQGCTLLHLACHRGDIAMVELLLQFGARINELDNCGRTPLHQCIISGSHDCAKLLLSRGANPATVDNTGKTPLQTAMELGDLTDEELFLLLS